MDRGDSMSFYRKLLFIWIATHLEVFRTEIIEDSSMCDIYTSSDTGEGNHCYIAITLPANWMSAQTACNAMGSHLVTVTSKQEHNIVQGIMDNNNINSIWLGAKEYQQTWQWLENGQEIFRQGCYKDTISNPDLRLKRLNVDNSYTLCENHCLENNYRYGGIQDSVACSCGSSFGSHGYSTSCDKLCPNDPTKSCGGKMDNDIFVVDGTFSNWGSGQPNNHLNYQSCAELESGNQFDWNDAKCTEHKGAICQLENSINCDNPSVGDTVIGNFTSCYIITELRMSWFDARQYCFLHGGHLATVYTSEINDILIEKLETLVNITEPDFIAGFWVGMTRTPWKWLTDEEFIFTEWASGNPNGNTQHCATMGADGQWQDTDCSGVSRFICEFDTSLPSTTTQLTSTTPAQTTTTLRLAPVRDKSKHIPFELEDYQLAAIVAGGVLVLIIIIIVIAVHCHFQRKKNVKRKAEKVDAKRNKFFFGFENEAKEDLDDENQNMDSLETEERQSKEIETDDQMTLESNNIHATPAVISNDVETDGNEEFRHSNLSEQPDIIPKQDIGY